MEIENQSIDVETEEQQDATLELPNYNDASRDQNEHNGIMLSLETLHLPFTQEAITTMLRRLHIEQRNLFNHVHK